MKISRDKVDLRTHVDKVSGAMNPFHPNDRTAVHENKHLLLLFLLWCVLIQQTLAGLLPTKRGQLKFLRAKELKVHSLGNEIIIVSFSANPHEL